MQERINHYESEIKTYEILEEELRRNKANFPEKDEVTEKLLNSEGKKVDVIIKSYNEIEKYKNIKLEIYGYSHINVEGLYVPLCGQDCVICIHDTKTGESIFENFRPYSIREIQIASIFGFDAGLKSVKEKKDYYISMISKANTDYKNQMKAIENIDKYVEAGKPYIYPQKHEQWKVAVASRCADLYQGADIVDAIKIMKALDEGKRIHKAEQLLSDNHSGISASCVFVDVLNFSKRGPEFFKLAKGSTYKYATKSRKKKMDKVINEIKAENRKFEKENSSALKM